LNLNFLGMPMQIRPGNFGEVGPGAWESMGCGPYSENLKNYNSCWTFVLAGCQRQCEALYDVGCHVQRDLARKTEVAYALASGGQVPASQ
jgi:hypothetical protein